MVSPFTVGRKTLLLTIALRAIPLWTVLAVVLTSFSVAQADREITPRVINGHPAADGAYPWMGALLHNYNNQAGDEQICGVTLIHPQYALTAAHCVLDYYGEELAPSNFSVLFGQSKLSAQNGERVSVRGIVRHPGNDPHILAYDLALLKLDQAVGFQPLMVAGPDDAALYQSGTIARVLGWGKTDSIRSILPDALQEATLPVHSDEECLVANGRWFYPEQNVCAGTLSSSATVVDGVDACNGDSGGPLVVQDGNQWKQIGVVSYGTFGCADTRTYGVYAETMAAHEFIYSQPTVKPHLLADPVINGAARVGNTIQATAGEWGGDEIKSVRYEWYRNRSYLEAAGDSVVLVGEGDRYTIQEDDLYSFLELVVRVGNAGGEVSASVSMHEQVATSSETPTPGETPVVQDESAPSSRLLGARCSKKRCVVTVVIDDPDYSSGIKAVHGMLKSVRSGTDSKGVSITTVVRKNPIEAWPIDTRVWQFNIRRKQGMRYKLQITAEDNFGYYSARPLVVRLNKFL